MGRSTVPPPILSAIICTRNRAGVLRLTLDSLCRQTLAQGAFEVIVVDDGSTDDTREVSRAFEARLPLRYSHQREAGLASARNHGVFLARGTIVLFLDDDAAEPALLEQHLHMHRQFPEPRYGVLGQTRLDASIAADPLMRFVTEIAGLASWSPPRVKHGTLLAFHHFSGGRSSCKRGFLLDHGMFDPVFRVAGEDLELAYRLSRQGFTLVSSANAVTTLVRSASVEEVCRRLQLEGESALVCSRLHPDSGVRDWADVAEAADAWRTVGPAYDAVVRSARELDHLVRMRLDERLPVDDFDMALLHRSYWAALRTSRVKGIVDASSGSCVGARPQEATG
jgi:glycosyltransferase involved in cell wall biosynthesis